MCTAIENKPPGMLSTLRRWLFCWKVCFSTHSYVRHFYTYTTDKRYFSNRCLLITYYLWYITPAFQKVYFLAPSFFPAQCNQHQQLSERSSHSLLSLWYGGGGGGAHSHRLTEQWRLRINDALLPPIQTRVQPLPLSPPPATRFLSGVAATLLLSVEPWQSNW